jgi:small subunit ribosomal protein S17
MTKERGRRKIRTGTVLSDKMDKTRVIGVEWSQPHRLYGRRVKRLTRFKAHDGDNATRVGDRVRIIETRPLSREKRWRILEVVQKAQVVDLRPDEVDVTLLKELEERPDAAATVEAVPGAAESETAPTAEVADEAPVAEEEPEPEAVADETPVAEEEPEPEAVADEAPVAEEEPEPEAVADETPVAEEEPEPEAAAEEEEKAEAGTEDAPETQRRET